jgi:alkaline phosphatase D
MASLPPYQRALAGLSRRELLRLAWHLGAAAVLQPMLTTRTWAQPLFDAYPFPLGVASGDPTPDGVVLWTRLAPHPLEGGGMPAARVDVVWEVASDPQFDSIEQKGTERAYPELAHSIHAEVTGLRPGRDYWYRFRVGRETSQIGHTRTAPAEGAPVDRLRFAICGCSHWEFGFFTAYRRMAEEDLDFILHTGDYIYEGRANGGQDPERVRQHIGQNLFSLDDYRTRYALYKTDRDLRAVHAWTPFVMSFDDHEVTDNYAAMFDPAGTPPEVFLLRRAAAYQAYYEHMPLRKASLPRDGAMRMYRQLKFGDLIDLSVLDTRQYRSDQACGENEKAQCADALDPQRTMLGDAQEDWLFRNLAAARARWTLIGQQVYSFAKDAARVNPNGRFGMDSWNGYVAARSRLYARIAETQPANPIVISGDIHEHYAADLTQDFTNPASPTIAVEFTNTSITAGGDGQEIGGVWRQIKNDNPHVKFHSQQRGYISCTATPSALRADFKTFERVTVPDLPARTAATFVVEAGKPGLKAG